jgi:hypothetical protein
VAGILIAKLADVSVDAPVTVVKNMTVIPKD